MIILHGNENKVYGGREMERKMNLSNFMYARLYDASKDMITNKFYLFIQSIDLTKECFIIQKYSKKLVTSKMGNNLNLFQCIFFVLFKLCICMLCVETMNMVPWMTTKWNAMHVSASQGTYSHDMLTKCMFMANNCDCYEFIIIYKERWG